VRRTLLKGKIHRATITEARLDYMGSLGIDRRLMKLAGIVPNEMVHVVNVNNGERLVTYAIGAGPGEIILNGAAARKGCPGDLLIIMTFAELDQAELRNHEPTVVFVDRSNRVVGPRLLSEKAAAAG